MRSVRVNAALTVRGLQRGAHVGRDSLPHREGGHRRAKHVLPGRGGGDARPRRRDPRARERFPSPAQCAADAHRLRVRRQPFPPPRRRGPSVASRAGVSTSRERERSRATTTDSASTSSGRTVRRCRTIGAHNCRSVLRQRAPNAHRTPRDERRVARSIGTPAYAVATRAGNLCGSRGCAAYRLGQALVMP